MAVVPLIQTPVGIQQDKTSALTTGRVAGAAALVLATSLALAGCIQAISARFESPEKAVSVTGVLFAAILAAATGAYILRLGRKARPETASLVFLTACSGILLATYFFCTSGYIFFPADILIWAEGDFVNDILKFSKGYPLYTSPLNNDSFHYVPGPQLLTYLLAWMAGKADSIPAYRVIQVVFTAVAAFVGTLCCRRILRMARPEAQAGKGWLWNGFWFAALFLIATNSITNPFSHNLHGDALAQLATIVSYYLLLVYAETRSRLVLAAMALMGPIGFLTKQSLLIWPVFYAGFLAVWGGSWKRAAAFAAAAAGLCGITIAACYAIWGPPFMYWIFYEMYTHPVSPLRSFQHVLDSWAYFAAGLLGGVALLRNKKMPGLTGLWLIWLALIALECYTSGIEWMLNHIGPGCLIAGVWFLTGLTCLDDRARSAGPADMQSWINAGAVTAAVALLFSGMGLVRIPLSPMTPDTYRYVHDIENQFQGRNADQILLDTGTWVYRRDRVIMKDRVTSLSTQASGDVAVDFSGFLSRLAAKRYSRILVRNFHQPDFWYDNAVWPRARGLRQAFLDNYRETGSIPAAIGPRALKKWAEDPHLFGEITILEPKLDPQIDSRK
jgi:hypothetical protein